MLLRCRFEWGVDAVVATPPVDTRSRDGELKRVVDEQGKSEKPDRWVVSKEDGQERQPQRRGLLRRANHRRGSFRFRETPYGEGARLERDEDQRCVQDDANQDRGEHLGRARGETSRQTSG